MEKKDMMLIGFCIVVFIVIVLIIWYIHKKRFAVARKASLELWGYKRKSMSTPHIENEVRTVIHGDTPGVSYTMNIDIEKWIHNKDAKPREIFTHGNGSFGNLSEGDIVSIAIDPHKNDIYIDVNTKRFRNDVEDVDPINCKIIMNPKNAEEGRTKKRVIERVNLKYFPLAKYFHVAIVLSKNRVDAYLDGKLNVTRILKGMVFDTDREDILPLKYFKGEPIKGHMSNFRYFNTELSLKSVLDIYNLSINPPSLVFEITATGTANDEDDFFAGETCY